MGADRDVDRAGSCCCCMMWALKHCSFVKGGSGSAMVWGLGMRGTHSGVHVAHTAGQCWRGGWAERQHLIKHCTVIAPTISEICGYGLNDSLRYLDA